MIRFGLILSLLAYCLLSVGCNPDQSGMVAETDEKQYQRGQRLLREGRQGEALAAFLKVVEKRPDAAESHLEAGILYQQHVGDPIASIYHLRRFIELRPESSESQKAEQLIETARKDFARTLPGHPYDSAIDRLDLLEMLESARQENEELKRQLAAAKQQAAAVVASNTAQRDSTGRISYQTSTRQQSTPTPQPSQTTATRQATTETRPTTTANARSYTVVAGDTLTRISTKVYGESGRWQDIFQANRDQLPNPNALRVGQSLRIPE